MPEVLKRLLFPYMPLGVVPDEGGAATIDRGDDFQPTGPDADAEVKDEKKPDADDDVDIDEAAKRAEAAAKKLEDADEDDEEEEKDEKKPEKRARIPKERLDQEIARRKAIEQRANERIQELERQIEIQQKSADVEAIEKKLKTLDDQYDDAIADGEKDKAKQIKAEMRALERTLSRAEATQAAVQAKMEALAEYRYDLALSQIEMEYPELNPDIDDFDKDKAEEVADLIEALKRRGNSPELALKRAVRYVLGPPKQVEKAAAEADRDIEKDGLRRAKEERELEARRKAADVVKKQPANLAAHGKDSDKAGGGMPNSAQISKMTQDQFAKLDEETKARLRGDEL